MDFSLFFFATSAADAGTPVGTPGGGDGYDLLLASARFADANGFAAVWTPERHFHPFGGRYPNPAVIGAALAAVTERVGIRAGSVVGPLHHPARITEEWSVVDNLSAGRVGVSFASGWHSGDFALRPDNYTDRRNVMIDTMETVRRLWRGEEVAFPDADGGAQALRTYPRPVQRELPVWIASGGSPETFRAAGRLGAGVLTHQLGQSHEALARNIETYRAELAAVHGSGAHGHVTVAVHTMIGPDRDQIRELVRDPFIRYVSSSIDLTSRDVAGAALDKLSSADKQFLAERGFDRHFETAGLFGTVDDGVAVARRLASVGVDEIACWVDFGVAEDAVLRSLWQLGELRRACAAEFAVSR